MSTDEERSGDSSRVAWIATIAPTDATGELEAAYGEYSEAMGYLSNVAQIFSLRPPLLRRWLAFQMELTFGNSALSRREEELIHVAISNLNECQYCEVSHGRFFTERFGSREARALPAAREIAAGASVGTALSRRESAMVDFARKLTLSAELITEDDIEELRSQGMRDREILDLVLVASYRNFMNRITLGLGVELEERFTRPEAVQAKASEAEAGHPE